VTAARVSFCCFGRAFPVDRVAPLRQPLGRACSYADGLTDPELPSVAWTGGEAASSSRALAEAVVERRDTHRTRVAVELGSCVRGRPPCGTILRPLSWTPIAASLSLRDTGFRRCENARHQSRTRSRPHSRSEIYKSPTLSSAAGRGWRPLHSKLLEDNRTSGAAVQHCSR